MPRPAVVLLVSVLAVFAAGGGAARGDSTQHVGATTAQALPVDGALIFEVYRGGSGRSGSWLEVSDLDGTGRRRLTKPPPREVKRFDTDVSWSPDGTKLVFRRDGPRWGDSGIYIANSDGTGLQRVASPNPHKTGFEAPIWSPDGSELLFASDGRPFRDRCQLQNVAQVGVWAVGSDGRDLRRIAVPIDARANTWLTPQDWAATTILYTDDRYEKGECILFAHEGFALRGVPQTGGRPRTVMDGAGWEARLSPDGRFLAFTADYDDCELVVADTADLKPRRRLVTWRGTGDQGGCFVYFGYPLSPQWVWSPSSGELFVGDRQGIFAFDPTRNRKRRVLIDRGVSSIEAISSDGEYIGAVRDGVLLLAADGSEDWKVPVRDQPADIFLP
jgi:dipeptidyl aminopeptidase/acylaminoacyl peptidase